MQLFKASDGASIAYEEEGSGRPLLMLHGLMANRSFFREQLGLAPEFRLIRPYLRGHGDSSTAGPLSVERLAQDISEFADQLALEDAIIVGWSLGASVLWQVLAGPAADRFAGAVVVDMTPCVLNEGEWQLGLSQEVCEAREAAIVEDFRSFATSAGQAIFAPSAEGERNEDALWAGEEFARSDAAAIASLWASLARQDFRRALGSIAQPTLIVHGAHSHLYGSDTAEHLAAALPNATAIQFERSGHSPHLEQPDLFNRVIRDFAATLPLRSHISA